MRLDELAEALEVGEACGGLVAARVRGHGRHPAASGCCLACRSRAPGERSSGCPIPAVIFGGGPATETGLTCVPVPLQVHPDDTATPGGQLARSGQPDGDLAGADVHALYLAGERVAVTAGDHRDVTGEPAVRTDHRDAERLLVDRDRDLAGGQAARDAVGHRVRDAVDVKL